MTHVSQIQEIFLSRFEAFAVLSDSLIIDPRRRRILHCIMIINPGALIQFHNEESSKSDLGDNAKLALLKEERQGWVNEPIIAQSGLICETGCQETDD